MSAKTQDFSVCVWVGGWGGGIRIVHDGEISPKALLRILRIIVKKIISSGVRAGVIKRKPRKTRKKKPSKKKARTKASTSSKTGKPRKARRKRKPKRTCSSKTPYTVRRKDYAVMESVRQALGLPEPDIHWSREVKEGLSITGNPDELDYFGDESPDEELPGFSSNGGIATRVLPRHMAVERLNLARRRRVKGGIELNSIASGNLFKSNSVVAINWMNIKIILNKT